jgi:transposase
MTWTIAMSNKELARKTAVERVLDHRITQTAAASKLGISERQFRRILQRYRQEGDGGLVSRKRGKPSNRRTDAEVRERVRDFIQQEIMAGFGPTMMAEKLETMQAIRLSKETVRKVMIAEGVWEAKLKRKVETHYERPRKNHYGEMVQIDGSNHAWLEERGPKAVLLVFVDDATSAILTAEFVTVENYFNYGELCKEYFRQHGLPKAFYSDKFSVFRSNHKQDLKYEPVTQFQRALGVLGVDLICANSPQAKGRVERANQTLQDRLIKEMRLLGISSYEEANRYLPEFIADYNRRFAVWPVSELDFHRPLDESIDLDFLFCVHDFRIVSKTLQIYYDGRVYQILTDHPAYFYAKQEVLITCDASRAISAWYRGNLLRLNEIEKRPKQTPIVSAKSAVSEPVVPAYNHPWRTYGKKINGKRVLTTLLLE